MKERYDKMAKGKGNSGAANRRSGHSADFAAAMAATSKVFGDTSAFGGCPLPAGQTYILRLVEVADKPKIETKKVETDEGEQDNTMISVGVRFEVMDGEFAGVSFPWSYRSCSLWGWVRDWKQLAAVLTGRDDYENEAELYKVLTDSLGVCFSAEITERDGKKGKTYKDINPIDAVEWTDTDEDGGGDSGGEGAEPDKG